MKIILENPLLLTPLLTGAIFIATGYFMMKFPPKEVNHLYGYRTPRSMKSQAHWDFAQRDGAKNLIYAGLALLACMNIYWAVPHLSSGVQVSIAIILVFAAVIGMFIKTERALGKIEEESKADSSTSKT